MKISKTVTHHIRVGPYESLVIGTAVELELSDNDDTDEALDTIDATINDALDNDLREVRKLAVEDSYIHDYRGTK